MGHYADIVYFICEFIVEWPVEKIHWFPALLANSTRKGKILDLVLIGESPLTLTLTINLDLMYLRNFAIALIRCCDN